ncbi:MAG: hypothetical protein WBH21_15955 [Vibrio anguillarum]
MPPPLPPHTNGMGHIFGCDTDAPMVSKLPSGQRDQPANVALSGIIAFKLNGGPRRRAHPYH